MYYIPRHQSRPHHCRRDRDTEAPSLINCIISPGINHGSITAGVIGEALSLINCIIFLRHQPRIIFYGANFFLCYFFFLFFFLGCSLYYIPRYQPRPHHCRRDRGQKAPLRHLGQHCQCGEQDGEHGQGGVYPGIYLFIFSIIINQLFYYYF